METMVSGISAGKINKKSAFESALRSIRDCVRYVRSLRGRFVSEHLMLVSMEGGEKDIVVVSCSDDLQKVGDFLYAFMKKRPDVANAIAAAALTYIQNDTGDCGVTEA